MQKIPYGFTKIHGDHIQNPLFLKPPDGKQWKIDWKKHEGDILFQKGWKQFTKYYSLAHGYMLFFEYEEKTSRFWVHIFNKNKVEIKYPIHDSQQQQQHNLNQISVQIPEEQLLPSKKRRPKSSMSCPQPRKKLRTHTSDDVGRTSKLQNLTKDVQIKEEIDDTTECAKVDQEKEKSRTAQALNKARNLRSKIPSFEVVMKSTYVDQYLYVPSQFGIKYLNTTTSDILLKVLDERTWLVRYYLSKFSVGWKTFVSDNNLKVGDVCRFELTKSQPLTFQVLISRVGKEQYSPPPKGKKGTKRNSLQTSPCTFTNDEALKKAEKFTSTLENPHFTINLKTRNWELYRHRVPKSFFSKNLREQKQTMMLKYRKKLWSVTLLWYPHETSYKLGRGWNLFAEESELEAGDVCVFELINSEDAVFDVHIFGGHS